MFCNLDSKFLDYELEGYFDGEIKKYKLVDAKNQFLVLIFYPLDFTFVCPTEIKQTSKLHEKFESANASVMFVSNDSVYSHKAWVEMKETEGGLGKVNFPMLSDKLDLLSQALGVFNKEKNIVHRATIIYDKINKVIKHLSINDDMIGRSTEEILRLLDACNFVQENGLICPCNFKKELNQ